MDTLKYILALFVSIGAFLFGNCTGLMVALLTFIIMDYGTGVMVAIVQKKVSSAVGAKGIAKKIFMLAIVAMAHLIDAYVVGEGCVIQNIAVIFYISNECISIIENAGNLGVPVPQKLLDVLAQLKKESE